MRCSSMDFIGTMSEMLEWYEDLGTFLILCSSQIHSTDTTSVITIPDAKLNHSGRYIINAESPAGHKVVKVRVNVVGK